MKISVITVNLNNKEGLSRTIESVLSQSYSDIEYIIIDGGSKDGSVDVIMNHAEHIHYWISEPDNGIYNGMNKGIAVASGDYCLFLNSGDSFYSDDVLEKITSGAKGDFISGNAYLADSDRIWEAPQVISPIFWLQRFSLCHQSTFIKTSLLKSRPYNEELKIVADYEQMAYEFIVNERTYTKVNELICNYSCDGISSNHVRADEEKIKVLDRFRILGYIDDDELIHLAKKLKPETRHYKLALLIMRWIAKC